jgi:hypothetical protein
MAPYLAESTGGVADSPDAAVNLVPKIAPTPANIKRRIDEEGGTTSAKVFSQITHGLVEINCVSSIHNTFPHGTTVKNTLYWSHSPILNTAVAQIAASKICYPLAAPSRRSPPPSALK